ncbi:hypothetical protein CDAR_20481 [Caerostris darwini]|uniref:Uncharacterized protein n=1 Tax=Caerostris darwini TaxID=1538125 RepID=A0AAV4QEA8_9ARAC|nr:hypothetical protein CDAR_20481 [Caerostris darwini]
MGGSTKVRSWRALFQVNSPNPSWYLLLRADFTQNPKLIKLHLTAIKAQMITPRFTGDQGMMYDPGIPNSIQEHPSIKLRLNTTSAGSEPILKLMMQRETSVRNLLNHCSAHASEEVLGTILLWGEDDV